MALSYNPHTIIFNLIQPYTILVFVKKIDWRFETFILLFAIFANLLFISVQIVIGWCAFKKIHLIFVMSFFCIRFSNLNYIIFVGFLHFRFLFFLWMGSFLSSEFSYVVATSSFTFRILPSTLERWLSNCLICKKLNMGVIEEWKNVLKLGPCNISKFLPLHVKFPLHVWLLLKFWAAICYINYDFRDHLCNSLRDSSSKVYPSIFLN